MTAYAYSVGYSVARELAPLCATEAERKALARCEAFKGTAEDLRALVAVYERHGRHAEAAELRRMVRPHCRGLIEIANHEQARDRAKD